jgi:hypothetical protein
MIASGACICVHMCNCEAERSISKVRVMVFNATFNNNSVISWRSVLLLEEIGVPREKTPTFRITDKLYHIMLHRAHLTRLIVKFTNKME